MTFSTHRKPTSPETTDGKAFVGWASRARLMIASARRLSGPLVFIALALSPVSCSETADPSPVLMDQWIGEGKTRVLVDGIHQLEGIPDAVWDENDFRYAPSQSTSRLLGNLLPHDFRFRQVKDGSLTLPLLRAHDILFFNVPTFLTLGSSKSDREMPTLRPEEVAAIHQYVEEGGSALIMGEHNNAYDNMEVLRPLLEKWGVELVDAYASEPGRGRYAMDVGGYMLMSRKFEKHFVTDGVRMISWSGGAPFTRESKGGIAFLSDKGYIDRGNYVTKKPRNHSNHVVDKGEYQGPGIPLVVALEVGKGRVIVVGDHNMFGTQWLGVGDNYRFTMNAMQWLAGREAEPPFRDTKASGVNFGIEQEISGWTIGQRDKDGYYGFYFNLSRSPFIFPRALVDLDDDVDILGLLEIPSADESFMDKLGDFLASGKTLFVLMDAENPSKGTIDVLRRFLPTLSFRSVETKIGIEDLSHGKNNHFPRINDARGRMVSKQLDVKGIQIAALSHDKRGFTKGGGARDVRPKNYENATPYLLDMVVEGGTPLAQAVLPDGRTVSIMDVFSAGGGEIILMSQGKIFSAHTMHCVREEPVESNWPAYQLEIRFMDWLVGRREGTPNSALIED